MRELFQGRSGRNYVVRPVTPADRALAAELIELDPDHRCRVAAETFVPDAGVPGQDCLALEDAASGELIFYFRLTRVLRIDIQFDTRKADNPQTLQDGFEWLMKLGYRTGHRQIIFDSMTRAVINFCKRRFGFVASPNELVCNFPIPTKAKAGLSTQHPVQTVAIHAPEASREGQ